MRFSALVASFALLVGTTAYGQDSFYVGAGLGSFDYEESFVDPILGRVSDSTDTWKLFGGFEFSRYFALEINYRETSDFGQSAVVDPVGGVTYTLTADFTVTTLSAIGQLPRDWGVLLGGIGFFSSENGFVEMLAADCCDPIQNALTIRDDGMAAMVGIEWRFGRFGTRYGVRLEYEIWDIDLADANSVGISFSYGF